ncbi:hypothetical protein EMIT07CA2_70179 [Brevibacillus sp. IT-7CA2]|uniref:hypothetical protein n=1 Tax=Brevibacillus sp. IT-7CA2 TaxID=3026436 RepID=UPI0039E0DB0F
MQVPSALDYDVYVLDELGEVVASSANGTGEEEMATFQATAGSKYYPVVHGFGFSTDEPYQLRLAEDQLYVFQPYDVSLPDGVDQVFQLTPTTDGIYRIYTGPKLSQLSRETLLIIAEQLQGYNDFWKDVEWYDNQKMHELLPKFKKIIMQEIANRHDSK